MLKKLLIASPVLIFLFCFLITAYAQTEYVCTPCDIECDTIVYHAAGNCPHCGHELVDKSTVTFTNIQIEDVPKIIAANKEVIILDVRTPEEHNGIASEQRRNIGKLKGAINIDTRIFETRLNEIEQYKDREVIVYCSHSHRSRVVSYYLVQNGFTNVKNMLDGISKWETKNPPGGDELYIDYNP